jgi:deoxyribonuclease IV
MPTKPNFLFGTVGSPMSTPKKPGGSIGSILRSAELDLYTLELGWVRSINVSEATCAAIKAQAIASNVALSVHATYFFNINGTDEEWPKSRKRLMDACYYGNLAGATDIIFHPGSYFQQPAAEVLKIAIPRLQGIVKELRDNGNPVRLRPETMGKIAMLGSFEDTLEMSAIEGVQPCIDFAHLHARHGDGSVNSYAEWDKILKTLKKKLGAQALKSMHIHISGIAYGPRGELHHLKFAEADLKYKQLLQALVDNKCEGRMMCESPIMETDAVMLKKAWTKLVNAKPRTAAVKH